MRWPALRHGGEDDDHGADRHTRADAVGRDSGVAAQSRLGIWTQRRAGAGPADSPDPAPHRPNLERISDVVYGRRISPSFRICSTAASTMSLMSACAPFGLLLSLVPAQSSLSPPTSKISVSTTTVTSVRSDAGVRSIVAPQAYG